MTKPCMTIGYYYCMINTNPGMLAKMRTLCDFLFLRGPSDLPEFVPDKKVTNHEDQHQIVISM